MTPDEAKVVRIHSLREMADRELAAARQDSENAREHLLDAAGALKLAMKLEEELAVPRGYVLRKGDPEKILAVEDDLQRGEEAA